MQPHLLTGRQKIVRRPDNDLSMLQSWRQTVPTTDPMTGLDEHFTKDCCPIDALCAFGSASSAIGGTNVIDLGAACSHTNQKKQITAKLDRSSLHAVTNSDWRWNSSTSCQHFSNR